MKNRRCIVKTLLLTGLLVFADVNLGFTSVNLYAAEASAEPGTEVTQTEKSDKEISDMNAEEKTEQERANLADGVYNIDVTLNGGSGRASVSSPAKVTVADGMATAELVWSSSNYDYMVVNGQKYLPVNTEGNSTFEIPVMCFDQEMTVIADTTAMSTPHEVQYALVFAQGSAKSLDSKEAGEGMDWNLVFLIMISVVTGATVAIYGTIRKK